jgi:RNA polymerase sigma-B factor
MPPDCAIAESHLGFDQEKSDADAPVTPQSGSAGRRSGATGGRFRKLKWDKKRTAELFHRCRASNDAAARDELITMYLNLVQYLASRFRYRGEPIDDLVQVGTIGLIKAVDRFDTGRGLEFTTYATPTIIGEIKRHFRDKTWTMRVPRGLQELSVALNRAVDALTRQWQRSPTIPEIAEHLGVSPEDVLQAMEASAAYRPIPLESGPEADEGGSFNLMDVIGENDPLIAAVEHRQTLDAALKGVSPLEQRALYLRFFEGATQSEIAQELGVSQMQISRMLRKTIGILRSRILSKDDWVQQGVWETGDR